MKKIGKILCMFTVMILLSGCVDYNVDMKINEDKSMDFSMKIGIDTSYKDMFPDSEENTEETILENDDTLIDDEIIEEEDTDFDIDEDQEAIENLKNRGYSVTEFKDGNIEGIIISKRFDNIDDISVTGDLKIAFEEIYAVDFDDKFFSVREEKNQKIYKAYITFDTSSDTEIEGINPEYMQSLVDFTYTVTLPNENISNNAIEISSDGKVLTWKLKDIEETGEINFEFGIPNENNNYMMYIIIGGICLLVVIMLIIIAFVCRRKKKNNNSGIKTTVVKENSEGVQDYGNELLTSQNDVSENKENFTPFIIENVQPTVVPQPKPVVQPTVVPQPRPVVQPTVVPQPKPVEQPTVVPQPRPVEQPTVAPQPRPVVQPTVVPQPKPVVQQDEIVFIDDDLNNI